MNRSISMFADIVLKNGVVVTVDSEDSICQAAAVKGSRIVYVGDNEGAQHWIGNDTKVIDLDGRALLPGFIDAHMHLGMRGQNAAVIIDCNSNDVTTIKGIQDKIREAARIRERALHDEASYLEDARNEGFEEGKTEGIEIGREKGRVEGRAEGIAEGIAEGRAEGIAEGRARRLETLRALGADEELLEKAAMQ